MIKKTLSIGMVCILLLAAGVLLAFATYDFDGDRVTYIAGDCKPFDAAISPLTKEISFDGIDQNCDGKDYVESDTADNDGDGFTKLSGDCNDTDPTIHLGADEIPDGKDNDCDGRVDERLVTLQVISSPVIPSVGAKQGLVGEDFLKAMSAITIKSSGPIYDGYLDLTATTKTMKAPNAGSKSVAVKMYLGLGTKVFFHPLDERYLDAAWAGKGNNTLNTEDAGERGGVFFAGQTRNMRLNLRSIPVTAKSQWNGEKDSLNLIELLEKYNGQLILGFYTSAPGFGIINSATLELEVDANTEITMQRP